MRVAMDTERSTPSLRGCLGVLVMLCLLSVQAVAGAVQETMPNGKLGNAVYLPGEKEKPAILILHGFLQTHDFRTVRRLADALNDEMGYSVLTPTLTLGIGDRRSSLACEAVQNHSFEDDVAEIGAWVTWLKRQGHRQVVLVGHSTGSVMIAAYLQRPDPAVIDAILISLTHFGPGQAVFHQQAMEGRQRAQRLLSANKAELQTFPIAYCRKYTATAPDILSYYRWDSDRVLQALGRSPVPVTVVAGSEDKRMTSEWLTRLKQAPMVDLRIIQGASHFFDAEYEFSLLDTLDEILQHLTDRQ